MYYIAKACDSLEFLFRKCLQPFPKEVCVNEVCFFSLSHYQ